MAQLTFFTDKKRTPMSNRNIWEQIGTNLSFIHFAPRGWPSLRKGAGTGGANETWRRGKSNFGVGMTSGFLDRHHYASYPQWAVMTSIENIECAGSYLNIW